MEEYWQELRWNALGPLNLKPSDLWKLTLGDLSDMVDGYRFRDYLELIKQASMVATLINGIGSPKYPIQAHDLVGYWVNGKIMDKMEYWEYLKKKAKGEVM